MFDACETGSGLSSSFSGEVAIICRFLCLLKVKACLALSSMVGTDGADSFRDSMNIYKDDLTFSP